MYSSAIRSNTREGGSVWTTVLLGLGFSLVTVADVEAEVRKWTDATGKYEIEAEFISLKNGMVILN